MICVDDLGSAFWLLFIEKIGFVELKSLCGSEGQRQVFEIIFLFQFLLFLLLLKRYNDSFGNIYKDKIRFCDIFDEWDVYKCVRFVSNRFLGKFIPCEKTADC